MVRNQVPRTAMPIGVAHAAPGRSLRTRARSLTSSQTAPLLNPRLKLWFNAITHRFAALVVALLACWPHSAAAVVPPTMATSGVILAPTGGPAPDGTYALSFGIYTAPTAGQLLWSEKSVQVQVKGGYFTYALGTSQPLPAGGWSLGAAWLGIGVASEPELPRQPLTSVLFAQRASVADAVACTGCITAAALNSQVLQGYAKVADLSEFVVVQSLAKVAGTGSYADLSNQPNLAKVATSGKYGDLTDKPLFPAVGTACGTGLVVKGTKADGSWDCASAGIGPDMLNEVSNNLLWNQFTSTFTGTKDIQIKDGFAAGTIDPVTLTDVGVAQALWIQVDVLNSDVSKVAIELNAPGLTTPYVLYKGGKTGTSLSVKFNDTTPLVSGDLNKDWVGKNPKGVWAITVRDTAALQVPPGQPPFVYDGKLNWSIQVQTLSTTKVQVKGDLVIDGKLDVAGGLTTAAGASLLFPPGSRPMLYGEYIDSMGGQNLQGTYYANAQDVPYKDNVALRNVVSSIVWADKFGNLQIHRGVTNTVSTTDQSRLYLVAFIKNPTAAPVTRSLCFRYASRSSANGATLALNGAAVWTSVANFAGSACQSVTFPANQSSSVVLKSGGFNYSSSYYMFRLWTGFYNNSLDLTGTGLAWDYDRYFAWVTNQ